MIRSVPAYKVVCFSDDVKVDESGLEAYYESTTTLTGPRRVEAQTPVALPNKPRSLQDLIDYDETLTEFMNAKCIPPTEREILHAQEKGDFFTLCDLLDNLIAIEWKTKKFTLKLRDQIRDAFAEVHKKWKRKGVNLQELLPENPTREQKDKIQRLKLFVEEGRGADSVIIYAKILLPFHPLAKNYHEKIRNFVNQKWYFTAEETLPGMEKPLAQLMGSSNAEYSIPLNESILIPERIAIIDQHIKAMIPGAQILSSILFKKEFLNGLVGEQTPCDLFIRGAAGSGKIGFIHHFLNIKSEIIFSPEEIRNKKEFGNLPMSQHESSFALNRLNSWLEQNVQRRLHYRPNISKEANDKIGKIAEKKQCVVLDLVSPLSRVQERMKETEKTGAHSLTEDEVAKSVAIATKNRAPLIQLALNNPKIYYIFYEANEHFIPIFAIEGRKLIKFNEESFHRICKEYNLNL